MTPDNKPRELSAAELWLNTTGTWEIWIDDVEGELAMEPNELARHKLEVVEYKNFELMSRELDKNHSAYAALEAKLEKAVELINFVKNRVSYDKYSDHNARLTTVCYINDKLKELGE